MIDNRITCINARIDRLKKMKVKKQKQEALHLMRETQKILQDDFTPELALGILSSSWKTASEAQKQYWRNPGTHSRSSPIQNSRILGLPTTKDELIRAYEELCEEFLAEIKNTGLY